MNLIGKAMSKHSYNQKNVRSLNLTKRKGSPVKKWGIKERMGDIKEYFAQKRLLDDGISKYW